MRVRVSNPSSFAVVIQSLSEFLEEAGFVITKEGLRVAGIDPGRVSYVELFLPSAYFEEFNVDGEKEVLGFRLQELTDFLSRFTEEDSLIIESKESSVTLRYSGVFERAFKFQTIEAEVTENRIALNYPFKAKLLTTVFSEVVSGMASLGDIVIFSSKENELDVEVKGDMGRARVELRVDKGSLLEAEGEETTSSHSIEYIDKTSKMRKASDTMDLYIGKDLPCRLHFELPQGGYYDVYVAPRLEESS